MSDEAKPTIALTGATGFLGSHLMASLLEMGHRLVILGRPAAKETLQERIVKLLRWFDLEAYLPQLELAEINFCAPRCGLSESHYAKLCAMTSQVIHCASDTSFAERNRSRIFESNVEGLKGILTFAAEARVAFLHYIGTAYAVGGDDGPCRETLPVSRTFTNVYEESKAHAEQVILDFCQKNPIPLKIIRPTIVYGNSQTGRALKFNALYLPIKSLQYIRDIFIDDILNNGGKKAQEFNIRLDDDGYLYLPMKLYLPRAGFINLIPVDYFVDAVMSVIEHPASNTFYHIASDSPLTMDTLAVYTRRLLKVKGVEVVYGTPDDSVPRSSIEDLFDRFIDPYRPYLSDVRMFERKNTESATGGSAPPELTYEIFERCMEYAMGVNWGKTLFRNETSESIYA